MKKLVAAPLLALALAAPALAAGYDDLNAGIQLFNRMESAAALPYFDRALASGELTDGLKFTAYFDRGITHLRLGNLDKAAEDLSASLALRPGDSLALSARADIHLAARKYEPALADLNQLIAGRPALVGPWFERLALHALMGRKDEALRDLEQARKALADRDLSDEAVSASLGMAHWHLERYAEAETHFADALPERGTYGWLWLSLARAAQGKEINRGRFVAPEKNGWPMPVAEFLLGREKIEGVMAAAEAAPEAATRQGQVCEANFYLGIVLRFRGNAAAPAMLARAAQSCPTGFVEWLPAQTAAAKTP